MSALMRKYGYNISVHVAGGILAYPLICMKPRLCGGLHLIKWKCHSFSGMIWKKKSKGSEWPEYWSEFIICNLHIHPTPDNTFSMADKSGQKAESTSAILTGRFYDVELLTNSRIRILLEEIKRPLKNTEIADVGNSHFLEGRGRVVK